MDELIFFAVIIFFSIIESVARSRKAKRGQGSPGESLPELPDADWRTQPPNRDLPSRAPDVRDDEPELPTYDRDPSYDDHVETPRSAPVREARSGPRVAGGGAAPSSSEVLLPGDLLEELARLAGRPQESVRRAPSPVPAPSTPAERPVPQRVPRRAPPPSSQLPSHLQKPATATWQGGHRIHKSHAGYGTDPSERAPSLQDNLDPLAERLSEDAEAVRDQLRSRNASGLRQAFILREVLGRPIALRDDE